MNFGLQTYTIRKAQKKSFREAYLPLVEMGISELEIARIDFSPSNAEKIAALSKEYGVKPVAVQVKPKYIFSDPEGIAEFCHATGCKNAVISMLPFKCILGREEKFYSFLSTLDKQYEIYERLGITLGYHHHNWEYARLSNGRTGMQELISKTEKIRFVHDTYWTARSGIDPARQIAELGERLLGVHLRDLAFKKNGLSVEPHDTYVGGGVIDFASVLRAIGSTACEYAVIEQKTDTAYADVARSYEYLTKIKAEIKE